MLCYVKNKMTYQFVTRYLSGVRQAKNLYFSSIPLSTLPLKAFSTLNNGQME